MATRNYLEVKNGIPGLLITLEYNDANLRIGNVTWTVPAGFEVVVIIWDTDIQQEPIYTRTEGTGSGSDVIPGIHSLVEFDDPDLGIILVFPDNLQVTFLKYVVAIP